MLAMDLLRDEGTELDSVGNEQQKPIEEYDTVCVAGPPVFDILDVEDDAEGDDGESRGPETEVACPDVFVVFDLECCLDCGCADESSDGCLLRHCLLVPIKRKKHCGTSHRRWRIPISRRNASCASPVAVGNACTDTTARPLLPRHQRQLRRLSRHRENTG
jgi:hypothetical protein